MELEEIRQTVRTFASKEIPPLQNTDHGNQFPESLWKKIGEAGLAGINVPEEFDGIGLTATAIMTVIEELAKVDLGPAIFLGVHSMVSGIVLRHGSDAQKKKYLPQLASGKMLGAFALTEPQAGSDAAEMVDSSSMVRNATLPVQEVRDSMLYLQKRELMHLLVNQSQHSC